MAVEISSFIASTSALADIVKAVISARDSGISAAVKADLTERLLQSQAQTSQVLGTIIEKDGLIQVLTQRVRELEAEQSEKARYRLAKLGTLGQLFAYELRPASELVERADEPPHFLCQPCFDASKKGILQIVGRIARCPVCNSSVSIEPAPPAPARQPRSTGIDAFRRRDW